MITFEDFLPEPGKPLYLQILHHIKQGAVAGTVKNGDELPSRRVLSALLGANPNTVQKAYRILEEEGLVRSHAGAKSYMVLPKGTLEKLRDELICAQIEETVGALRRLGLDKAQALALIENNWDKETTDS